MKRILCVLLSLLLALTGLVGLCVPTGAEDSQTGAASFQVGDIVRFGSYPQTRVTSSSLVSSLNAAAGSWQSYRYYSGTGDTADGGMTAKDFMQYCDVTISGTQYRGVRFTQFRPRYTGYSASAVDNYQDEMGYQVNNSYQDDNGYQVNTTYWFRCETLEWRVLDPATGLVLCEEIIDSQPVNNYALIDGTKYYGNGEKSCYANNYEQSSLRAWLNDDFYNTAFSAAQKDAISATTLDNSAYSTSYAQYGCASTTDKIFLLSYREAANPAYGFSNNINANDPARQGQGTDYAKCQGLMVAPNGNSQWWLRTGGYTSASVCNVHSDGYLLYNYNAYYANYGVRPAITLDLSVVVAPFENGDIVELGSYPQTHVTNENTLAKLNAAAPDFAAWTSYGYYTGTGNDTDGQMTASDYMKYCDVTVDGQQFRGVRFTQYRPWLTGLESTAGTSSQDSSGYEPNVTHWFRYKPLQWRVLDAEQGLLLCESIIDSQSFHNYVLESGTDTYGKTAYWGDARKITYANDYAGSDVRMWMNLDFLYAAFSQEEQDAIQFTVLDNSADTSISQPAYGSVTSSEKVFLLTYADVQNEAYGFTDNASRRVKGTAYAKCQGLSVSSSYSPWRLRSPGASSREAVVVSSRGALLINDFCYATDIGIRPAITVDLDALLVLTHDHDCGEPEWHWADDHSSASATFSCVCGYTKTVTDDAPAQSTVSAATCTADRVDSYTATVTFDGETYTTTENAAVSGTALGHDWNAAWSYDMFYHWHECARCGAVTNKASHRRTPLSYSWEQEGDVWKATASCRCMLCHAQWSETVTATGTVTKQPTCTQNGETTYKASFELGGGFATKKVADIDPLGHSWDDNWEYYDAQQHVRHCTACGEPEYQDHNVSLRGAAEATCGKDGYTGDDYCTACGRTLSEGSVIPATGAHDYSAIHKTVQPTCTKNGYTVYKCANCGTVNPTHKEIVPALGHDYSVEHEKVDPTCTEDGYIVYECSRCGEVDPTQHVVEALGHDYSDVHRTVEPTCTKEGYTFYKCAHCGKVDPTHKDIVDPLGHDYSVVHEKAEPTCTEGGYTVYACSRCSEVDPTHKEIVDPLGHAWGGWEIVRPATPTEKGEKKHTCTRCGVSETAEYEEQGELLLHSSADDQTGNALIVTVPYARRGSTATQLTANASVTYTSSDPKLLAVDANGKVTFSQLNIFRKSATVTAVTPDGRTASCEVRISLKWWHYIVWFLLGFLWY